MINWLILGAGIVGGLLLFEKGKAADPTEVDADSIYDGAFQKAGQAHRVPWRWLKAIAYVESSLGQNPRVQAGEVSEDGLSYGLMQVTLATAKGLVGRDVSPDELNNSDFSIDLAAQLFAQLIAQFGIDDRESIVRAYNGGPSFTRTATVSANTAAYYSAFTSALARVMAMNPGQELEGYA